MTTMDEAFDVACQTLHTIYQNIDTLTKGQSPDMDGDKLDGDGQQGQGQRPDGLPPGCPTRNSVPPPGAPKPPANCPQPGSAPPAR